MFTRISRVLDAVDNPQASEFDKVCGCLLWLLIIGTFAGCCLYFAIVFS